MRNMRGKKTPKKEMEIPHFYDVTGIKSGADWTSSNINTVKLLQKIRKQFDSKQKRSR